MISDARPLQPEFVPADVRHRDGEINALTGTLRPILRNHRVNPILLHGPSGTGKTCIARYALDQLRSTTTEVTTQYVNCWDDYTRFKTLYRVLDGLNQSFDIHRQATPRDELTDRLRDALDTPYVVILDEVDQLDDKDVLYDLHRIPEIALILIANADEALFAQLDERIVSRFSTAERIHFGPYSTAELVAILRDRVRWGLHENAASDALLRQIATAASGDARMAISTLRAAAQTADQYEQRELTEELVDDAAPKAKAEIQRKNAEKLTPDQRTLYTIIQSQESVAPADLYDRYCEQVEEPKSRRTMRNYLEKMRRYNLVTADGEGKARTYKPV